MSTRIMSVASARLSKAVRATAGSRLRFGVGMVVTWGALALSGVSAMSAQAAPVSALATPRTISVIDGDGSGDSALSQARIRRFEPGVLADANDFLTSWWDVGTVSFANVGGWTQSRADHRGWRMFLTRHWLGTGKLGYHAVDRYGPYAVVSVSAAARYGTPLSLVVSHELNEMMVDPNASETSTDGFYVEVVDPVADVYSGLDGVEVADFVTPNWLAWNGNGPWDAAGVLTSDHTTTSGGYDLTAFLKTHHHARAHLRQVTLHRRAAS